MIKLSDYTVSLLDDIERRIDPEAEEDYREQWKSFWHGEYDGLVFKPCRKKTSAPGTDIKPVHINDAIGDFELMLDSELASLSKRLSSTNQSLGIRANYGTGIMTSLFGAEVFMMPRETNTLPTTKSFNDSDRIREIIEKGVPDLQRGFGGSVLSFGERCAEIFENYPKIKKYVDVYHPDAQGPLDVAELLWGGEMFYEMYDEPELVHAALRLVTDTYKALLEKWYKIIPVKKDISVHWGWMHKGPLMLRLDSAMNLSPEFYDEFSKPYDSELFDHFGGGCMHFCGRGDHFVPSLCEIEKLYGINLSQPHLNDMDKIFSVVSGQEKRILGLPGAEKYAENPHLKKGTVSG